MDEHECVNIDRMIDTGQCPTVSLCYVATTELDPIERERVCYRCWRNYCREHEIEIAYNEYF